MSKNYIEEGWGICPTCNKEYYAQKIKFPFTDITHEVACPSCEATVGWVPKGTDDFTLISEERIRKQQEEEEKRPNCPLCGQKMVLRKGYSEFWGCPSYPACKGTLQIED